MAEQSDTSSSSARQVEPQEEMSFCSPRQAEPQEGKSSSSARQAEPQEEMSSCSAQQAEPQEGMSSSSAPQAEPMEGISSSSAQQTELLALKAAVRSKKDECEKLATRLWRCNFIYTPPEENFDSKRVMGTICSLINGCDPIHCTALEIAAGRRLYSVVVDSEPTSRLLLRNGNLQTRTTFIPLNKINGYVIDRTTVKVAQEIGGGSENVQLALDLVLYDIIFRPAMEWVFGGTLVCRDSETAKNVAFHPAVRCRVVTLDGDIFDPNGTMTGGAKLKGRSVLAQLRELKNLEEDLKMAELDLSLYTSQLKLKQQFGEKYTATKQTRNTSTAGHRPPSSTATSTGSVLLASSGFLRPSPGHRSTLWEAFQRYVFRYAVATPEPFGPICHLFCEQCALPLKCSNSSSYFVYLGVPTDLFISDSIT